MFSENNRTITTTKLHCIHNQVPNTTALYMHQWSFAKTIIAEAVLSIYYTNNSTSLLVWSGAWPCRARWPLHSGSQLASGHRPSGRRWQLR